MPRKKPPAPKSRRRRRGTGSIAVSSDGTIRARLPAGIDPGRRAKEFPPGHESEALAWLDSFLHPVPEETPAAATVEAWAGVWWQAYVEPVHAPNTARSYLHALQKLAPVYGVPLPDLRASALQAVVGELAATLAPSVVQGIVGVWRRCFDAAIEDQLLARNPARRLALPKAPPRPARRHVTPAEAALVRSAIVGHRFEAAYALLLGCGLRIGEVLGLSWANVDLAGRKAWIQRQWTNSHWRELPKSRAGRYVRLPDAVVAALIRHRNQQPAGAVLVMQSPFGGKPGRKGRRAKASGPLPWSRHAVASDLATIMDALELSPATPHAFRRGLATALLEGRVSPVVIAGQLGHADPSVTLKAYTQATDAGAREAAELIDRYLGSGDELGEELA